MAVGLPVYFWDGGAAIRRLLQEAGTTETTLGASVGGTKASAIDIEASIHALDVWRSEMLRFFRDHDVILCPVCAAPAMPHGQAAAPAAFPQFSYTFTYNLTGWPGAVVRAGTSPEGLPIGVQIVARPGREDVALAVAGFVERSRGGYQRPAL